LEAAGAADVVEAVPAWFDLPSADELFVCLFTSGSEGELKVVEKRARQIYRQAAALTSHLQFPRGAHVLAFVPPFHLLGFFYGLCVPWLLHGTTLFAHGLDALAMGKLVGSEHPALVVGTAIHYRYLAQVDAPAGGAAQVFFLSSGAPLDPAIAEAFARRYGTSVRDFYGTTEVAGVAYRAWPEPYQPMPGVQFRIDPSSSALQVSSPWANAEHEGAWIATGDAAEPAGDGRFVLLGRLGHLVKVGGKRFSSLEVEQAIRAMPGVRDAAVVPYERFGESAIAAFVSPEPGTGPGVAEVRAWLAARLAPFKLPRTIRLLADLPRARLSKLDYKALRALVDHEDPSDP
jgi:acyl-coenzyme A synthetase/AMP-(fatty) acid ligase